MKEVVNSILMTGVSVIATMYVWHQLLDRKPEFKSIRFWLIFIGLTLISALNYYTVNGFIRIVSITVILMLTCSYLFRENIKVGVITTLMSQMITMISETIFVILISIIMNSGSDFIETNQFGTILANATISIIVLLIMQFDYIKRLYLCLNRISKNIKDAHLTLLILIFIIILNIFSATAYYKLDFKVMLVFNVVAMIIYFVVIMNSLKSKHDYIEVYDKYNTTISSLKEYEDILNQYRVSNHENKNELLTIRNMIKNKEKNIPEYIDKIVENKLKDNEYLMGKSMVIPEGGLRGLIYSKMLVMKDRKIDFDLSIDKAIKTVQLIELGDNTVLDICKIMGVLLDNAIEAVSNLEERFIDLEMSIEENKLYISVTNNYEGTIAIEEMGNHGYTTKGKGHGYGLSLVKKLIDKNSLLKNEKEISGDEFTQRLVVNVSKL